MENKHELKDLVGRRILIRWWKMWDGGLYEYKVVEISPSLARVKLCNLNAGSQHNNVVWVSIGAFEVIEVLEDWLGEIVQTKKGISKGIG